MDDAARSAPLREQLALKFPLLCDPDRTVVKSYGVLNTKEMGGIAYPAVFVIDRDRDRVIRFRALETVARRTDINQLLELVRGLGKGSAESASQPRQHGLWPGEMFFRATMNAILRGVRVPRK